MIMFGVLGIIMFFEWKWLNGGVLFYFFGICEMIWKVC